MRETTELAQDKFQCEFQNYDNEISGFKRAGSFLSACVTHAGLDGSEIDPWWRQEIFSLHTRPDRSWGQNSVLCNGYRGAFRGVNLDPHLAPRSRVSRSVPVLRLCACMASYGRPLPLNLYDSTLQIFGMHLKLTLKKKCFH